jgi:hypothetical protein
MTLPFAFVFIGIFVIAAIVLIVRQSKGKREVGDSVSGRKNSPQGPVDTSESERQAKAPLKKD